MAASPTGPNPASLLPAAGSYQPEDKLGEHVSATLAEYVKLIMKVSYNRGADLMTCLAAVKTGSTDCEQGLVAEVDTFTELGVSKTGVFPFDGAGSNDQNRATPTALATFYQAATQTPYADALFDSLPILGMDGTLANVLTDSPAAGKPQIKTGNRVVGTAADQTHRARQQPRRLRRGRERATADHVMIAVEQRADRDDRRVRAGHRRPGADGRRDPGSVLKHRARSVAAPPRP